MTLIEILRRITYALHEYFEEQTEKTAPEPSESVVSSSKGQTTCSNMDDAGRSTKFINRCSRCGELGRNLRTCKDEMREGTYHWVEVKA